MMYFFSKATNILTNIIVKYKRFILPIIILLLLILFYLLASNIWQKYQYNNDAKLFDEITSIANSNTNEEDKQKAVNKILDQLINGSNSGYKDIAMLMQANQADDTKTKIKLYKNIYLNAKVNKSIRKVAILAYIDNSLKTKDFNHEELLKLINNMTDPQNAFRHLAAELKIRLFIKKDKKLAKSLVSNLMNDFSVPKTIKNRILPISQSLN